MSDQKKLTLEQAAARMSVTPDQLLQMVKNGEIHADGEGEALLFNPAELPRPKVGVVPLELDDDTQAGDQEDFTLKLMDEGEEDSDLTAPATPPPPPTAGVAKKKEDTNIFGDDTVDLMDTAGATDTIELTEDSIAGLSETDSLLGGDTLAGGDTLGTDTVLAADSLAETESQETFLGADILEGLSGDTTAEITSEVQPEGVPVQYVAAPVEKSPITTAILALTVVVMVLTVIIFVNGQSAYRDSLADTAVFNWVKGIMGL